MKKFFSAFLVYLALGVAQEAYSADPVVQHCIALSVTVTGEKASGSGVMFRNGDDVFVWTAGHVVEQAQTVRTVIDQATGQPKVEIVYDDLWVRHEEVQNGRKVGEERLLAQVLRYSSVDQDGDDIGILRIRKKGATKEQLGFISSDKIPSPGDALWDVGARMGFVGDGSVSKGVLSTAGRLRRGVDASDTERPKVYDQVTLDAQHGSSGGGVFDEKGECVGLLTQFSAEELPGSFLIIPTRRLREFAVRTHCEWAMDASVKVPGDDIIADGVTDRPVPVPDDWKKPAPSGPEGSPIPLPFPPFGIPLPAPKPPKFNVGRPASPRVGI